MNTHQPHLSVIVPTCDRVDQLAACLACLAPGVQTLAAESYEVIVTDDGAPTVEAFVARDFPWVRWIRGPRRGPAANRNHGAACARAEWLAFTDDDCLPSPGWLEAFAKAAPGYQAMEGRTTAPGPRLHPLDISPINDAGGCFWSCNIALARSCFEAAGGFDESFPFAAMEDVDFRLRLTARNVEIGFVPAAHVSHPWRRITDFAAYAHRHLQSRLIVESRHPGKGLLPWGRLLLVNGHTLRHEILPFFRRKPGEAMRLLGPMVRQMVIEFWVTFRRNPGRIGLTRGRAHRPAPVTGEATAPLLIIAPRVPPVMCGIGDFTFLLAKKIREQSPRRSIRFAVTDPANPADPEVDGFAKTVINVRDESALLAHFEAEVPQGTILLQFAQYDYDDHARPAALVAALARWRAGAPGRRLGIFAHELWLPRLARRREWSDYPWQWLLARKLFRAADVVHVSNRRSAELVARLRGSGADASLPIFSTIGEPALLPGSVENREEGSWIFFGSAGRTLRSLRRFGHAIRSGQLPRSTIRRITVIGGQPNEEIRSLLTELGFPAEYRPDRPAAEVSAELHRAAWGFLDYDDDMGTEPTLIFKSTVFAAMLAHGVVPVLPEPCGTLESGGEKLPDLLTPGDFQSGAPPAPQRIARALAAYAWYGRHASVARHAAALRALIGVDHAGPV